jgi:hypothetical protein
MQCEMVSEVLPSYIEKSEPVSVEVRKHIEGCVRCQAELVQYKKLLRNLHNFRTKVLEPAPGLLSSILASIEKSGEKRAIRSMLTGRKAAYAGGIAVASAAGLAGVVILARHRSRSKASNKPGSKNRDKVKIAS